VPGAIDPSIALRLGTLADGVPPRKQPFTYFRPIEIGRGGQMYGDLTEDRIDQLLAEHRFGRLGFISGDNVFILPVDYAYDGQFLYGQAPEGAKIETMRRNPHVAFLVDDIKAPNRCRSVLLHGLYIELHDRQEKEEAYRRILAQAGGGDRSEVSWAIPIEHLVVFKIQVTDRSARFERSPRRSPDSLKVHNEWPLKR
jgi:uncharacterized protein